MLHQRNFPVIFYPIIPFNTNFRELRLPLNIVLLRISRPKLAETGDQKNYMKTLNKWNPFYYMRNKNTKYKKVIITSS